MQLGRLKKVELREVWTNEAGDFTPWLAQKGNIKILGDAIGIDLEVETHEKEVGPFRADILCKDTASDDWVLIENQLEKTDHTHLGQILTYAAGLKAFTTIWIAKRFTDEHRATLDWLNNITGPDINFFGLEVELWKIGDSPIAPKFNIVSKPNDWTKTPPIGNLSELKRLYLDYWIELRERFSERNGIIKPQKASPQQWVGISIGRSGVHINATVNSQKKFLACKLIMNDENAKAYFGLLKREKDDIESEMGAKFDWRGRQGKKECYITITKENMDILDRKRWEEYHTWFINTLETMHKVFSNRVKKLDPEEYLSEE